MAALAAGLAGCSSAMQPFAMALAGAGTTSIVSHGLSGTAYRTFTHPVEEVKAAALESLSLMGIRVEGFEAVEHGQLILGSARQRTIEVELEQVSKKATRMRVVTRNGGIFYDAATATEIVLQTEKALGVHEITVRPARTGLARRR